MPSGPSITSRIGSVVILRALAGVGDHLCTVPALRALRAGLPHAHVALLTVPKAEQVISRFPEYVDELVPFAGFPGLPEKPFVPADLPAFFLRMIRRRFDLALQLQGNGLVSNSLVAMLGARLTAGYVLPGQYRPDEGWFIEYPGHLSEVRRHLALMAFLGFPGRGEHLEFPVTGADRAELAEAVSEAAAIETATSTAAGGRDIRAGGRGYVCIHPGATAEARRWSPAGFAGVADMLAGAGMTVLLTGLDCERELVGRVRGLMAQPVVDLTGRTSLGALAALIEGAALVVCNDTGISHLAAALRTPSVVIFAGTPATGSDPVRWAPLDRELHRVVARTAPAGGHRHDAEPPGVSLSSVLRAVREQLTWASERKSVQRPDRTVEAGSGRPGLRTAHAS